MKLSFHGANHNVTGSCHLVECGRKRILIDCGLFQGGRELSEENEEPFGFDPSAVDFLLLTHAHLDHCGRLPLLVKRGFRGEIIATSATRELARLVMLDSGHLHEHEAQYSARHAARRGNHRGGTEPLYTELDALNSLDYFGRSAGYDKALKLASGISATFIDAGHILGSSSIYLELEEKGKRRTVLFSGDLGNCGHPILRDPAPPPKSDIVIMETTYGDRLHRPIEPSVEEFYAAVLGAIEKGGNVVIPTFALERAQEILFFLREGVESGRLPASLQVFLDSPMAISATSVFKRHPECYDEETARLFREGHDPLALPGLHFTRETEDSVAINRIGGGVVIMAGSGMCTGGRIRHHLRHNLWRSHSSIIFVGYAANGTLARRIIDGATHVQLLGEDIQVKANIYTINGFSAHADQGELLAWHRRTGNPEVTFLVHGEEETMDSFGKLLENTRVEMPAPNQSFEL
jgi:metallo-beta-lactamase family protein